MFCPLFAHKSKWCKSVSYSSIAASTSMLILRRLASNEAWLLVLHALVWTADFILASATVVEMVRIRPMVS